VVLSLIVAHAALSADCRPYLIDGKQVELGLWKDAADVFVGPDVDAAIATLRRLQTVMDNRYSYLMAQQRRKIERGDAMNALVLAIDLCRAGNYADSLNRANHGRIGQTSGREGGEAAHPTPAKTRPMSNR
jgi:hypothetical protein